MRPYHQWHETQRSKHYGWFILALAIALLAGCSTTEQTVITRTDTLRVFLPAQYDTVTISRNDTVWSGENTKYIIRIDTLFKKVFINRKPDTVYVPYVDTVSIFAQKPDEPSWLERNIIKLLIYGGLFVALIMVFRKAIQ